jgi:FkbM family methyltransferase
MATVKLRDLPRALGLEQSPREYPHAIVTCVLRADGEVRLARWLHPAETAKCVTQESVDALRSFLIEGDVAIDIGAHTGDSTIPMALAVGPRGSVFALEPNPYVFKVLAVNAGLNPSRTHIVPLMFAAMPGDGEFEFEYSDSGYCNGGWHQGVSRWTHGHFSKLRVAGRNLPAYLRVHAPDALPRIRFVKIDTEGFDRMVVQSLADLIAAVRPYIKTEIYKHLSHQQRTGYYDDLRHLGYRLFKCEDDRDYRGQEIQRDDLLRWKHFDIFAVPDELA